MIPDRLSKLSANANVLLERPILSLESTELAVTMDPDLLPWRDIDPQRFMSLLHERYRLNMADITDDPDLLRLAIRQRNMKLQFTEGLFVISSNVVVKINSATFTRENIGANVAGHSDIAEALVAELFEVLWESAGISKSWGDHDVQSKIQLKAYAAQTKVEFGIELLQMLSPSVATYLESSIQGGPSFGQYMIPPSAHDGFKPRSDVICSILFDRLDVNVVIFDPVTGRSETARVRFDITSRDDYGRGICDVITQLPLEQHVAFVRGLIAAIRQPEEELRPPT